MHLCSGASLVAVQREVLGGAEVEGMCVFQHV